MSEALISSLNSEVSALRRENAELKAESKQRRLKLRESKTELEELRSKLGGLESERDEWKMKAEASPRELQGKVDTLTKALRARDHRDAWKEHIGPELADKVSVEKLWAEIGYEPGETVPTAEEIKSQASKAFEAAPYLRKPAEMAKTSPNGTHAPPPGGGRAAPASAPGKLVVRPSDYSNAQWMAENRDRIAQAHKEGLLVIADS